MMNTPVDVTGTFALKPRLFIRTWVNNRYGPRPWVLKENGLISFAIVFSSGTNSMSTPGYLFPLRKTRRRGRSRQQQSPVLFLSWNQLLGIFCWPMDRVESNYYRCSCSFVHRRKLQHPCPHIQYIFSRDTFSFLPALARKRDWPVGQTRARNVGLSRNDIRSACVIQSGRRIRSKA
jgi:hypothetical protein